MKILFCLIILFICVNTGFSQSLLLYDVDYSKYPQITSKFTATDTNGRLISNLVTTDFQVKENGNIRKVISIDCPPVKPTIAISSVLVLDVSGSMSGNRVKMTQKAAATWLNYMDFSKSECAISVFNDQNAILADFSQSKQFLLSRLQTLYASQFGWTDYNKALLDPPAGGIEMAKFRPNKKVIVFLTDGSPNNEPYTDSIIKIAKYYNITIHCISFYVVAPDCMQKIAFQTGGMLFSNVKKQDKLNAAFKKILDLEQESQDCSITWESEPSCDNINAVVTLLKNNSSYTLDYQTPPDKLPNILIRDKMVDFKSLVIKAPTYLDNMFIARNGDIEILNITSDNTDFSCTPLNFKIAKNDTGHISVSYTAQDSGYSVAKFSVKTNLCQYEFFAKAGNPYYIPQRQQLKVLRPNGFEKFLVGSDTLIGWTGVAPSDTISLEYSINSGNTWSKITDSATGLVYPWNNIPNTPSDQCLMRARFKEGILDNFSLKGTALTPFGFYRQVDGKSSLTIEAWIYYTGSDFSIIKNNFEIVRRGFNKQELWITGNFDEFRLDDAGVLDSNKWYHVALVIDRNLSYPVEVFYLNGIKIKEVNNKIIPYVLDYNDNITIGSGNMDEFRMWTTRRLGSEIYDNKNKSLSLPQTGLMLYYDFDLKVNKAVDISGFKHDATGNITKSELVPFIKTMPTQIDVSDNLWSIVKSNLQGKDIDMGFCELGNSKDSTIAAFLRNKGTFPIIISSIDFSGINPGDFSLVSGFVPFEIKAGGTDSIEFRFNPQAIGDRNAVINIHTNDKIYTQYIRGLSDKVYINLSTGLIDFGIVKVGSHRDTLIKTSIINNSSKTINFTKSYPSFPNDKDFSISQGGGSFSLNPGDAKQMTLTFTPSFSGKTSGSVAFEFDAPGSPMYLQLMGEGVFKNATISAEDLTYQTLICENEKTDSIYIRNSGVEDLKISDYNIDNTDFTIINQLKNITIKSDAQYTAIIKYLPKNSGNSNARLRIFSNSYPDSVYDIQLGGRKEFVDYTVSNKTIELGYLCQSEIKKFSVDVSNTGTLSNKFILNLPAGFSSDYLKENTDPKKNKTINFDYTANNIEKTISEVIEVTDSICNKKTIININGIIQNPRILSPDVTLTSFPGSFVDGEIVLQNNSDRDLIISSYPNISSNELTFDNLQLPISIKAHESKNLSVKYTPKDEINDEFKITYNFEPCSQVFIGTVYGNVTVSSLKISVGDYEAFSNETIDMLVEVSNAVNFDKSGITKIKANITFNSTMLIPVSGDKGTVVNKIRSLDVEFPIVNNIPQSVNFNCIAGLGNDSITVIKINDVTFEGGETKVEKKDGSFKLKGICNDGGARLLSAGSKTQIISIDPTPTESTLGITFELRESENTIVELISSTGEATKLINQNMQKGKYQYEFDISNFPSGIYYLLLRTRNDIQTKKVIISK